MKRGKRLLSALLALAMLVVLMPQPAQAAGFRDIASHWARDDIEEAVDRGLFTGTSGNAFSPDAPMTRAMFVTVLYRADDGWYEEDADFVDVSESAWYYDAVCWASENGLVTGTDSWHFSPNRNVTREQMVAILYRYLNYTGATLTRTTNVRPLFYDRNRISSFAQDAVEEMQFAEIIRGKPDGAGYRFDPQGNATRAEAAHVFRLFFDQLTYDDVPEVPEVDASDAMETFTYTTDELSTVEETYAGDDGYIAAADLPDVFSEMEDIAEEWKQQDLITMYEVNDLNFTYRLKAGITTMYMLKVREYKDTAGSSASVQTYEPYYTVDTRFNDAQAKHGYIDTVAKQIQNADNSYTFDGDYNGSKVTIESLKHWKPDSIIIWLGHGGYSESMGSALGTPVSLTENNYSIYKADLDAGRLITSGEGRLAVTPKFFQYYYESPYALNHSLIWLGACSSHKDDKLTDALLSKGASTVIGSDNSIYIPYLANITYHFFDRLSQKDSSGAFYHADDALAYAKNKAFWSTDSFFFAEMDLLGDADFRLGVMSASISGVVTSNTDGKPVQGAKVYINVSGAQRSALTDANGKYTISQVAPNTSYPVGAHLDGCSDVFQTVHVGDSSATADFVLTSNDGQLRFRLEPDVGSISKGTATVYRVNEKSNTDDVLALVTDKVKEEKISSIYVSIDGLESGVEYEVKFDMDGFEPVTTLSPASPNPVTSVVKLICTSPETVKPKEQTISIKAVDADSGAALSGAAVSLSGNSGLTTRYTQLASGKTNASGVFAATVDGVYTKFSATVTKDGYQDGSLSEASGTSHTVKLSRKQTETPSVPEPDNGIPSGFTPIYTAEEFEALQGSEKVVLMNDLSGVRYRPEAWEGILDGNGHTLSNLTEYGGYAGSGGWMIYNNGTIRNLRFRSISIEGKATVPFGLIGTNYGTIENCVIESGSVSVSSVGGHVKAGGLVGINYGTIRNCVNAASVTVSVTVNRKDNLSTSAMAGGIAAYNYKTIDHCLNLGSVSATSTNFVDVYGIAEPSHSSSTEPFGTATDCGNGGSLYATANQIGNGAIGIYKYAISTNATDGYATDPMGFSDIAEVSLSELRSMWSDLI